MASRPVRLKLLPRTTIKAKNVTRLVGQVLAGTGVTATKSAGNWTVAINTSSAVVFGPASSVDNAIVRWDGTGGNRIQNSAPTISDAGVVTIPNGAGLQVGSSVPFSDAAGILTLQNVDALDTTTRATVFEPYTYQIQALDDGGVSDQSAAIQAQIDYCKAQGITHCVMPPYLIWAEGLTVDFPLHIQCAPTKLFEGDASVGAPGEYGTRFIAKIGDDPIITFATGANGAMISDPFFMQEHDADGPGWTPTVYPPCILNISAGTWIVNPIFYGCYDGIHFGRLLPTPVGSGQCTATHVRAACYRNVIRVVGAGDWVTVDGIEAQMNMLGNDQTNKLAYINANAIVYYSAGRNDAPVIKNIRSYGYKGAIFCEEDMEGGVGHMQVSNMWIDSGIYAIHVTNAGSIVQVEQINFTGRTGSFCVQVEDASFVQIAELRTLLVGEGTIYALNGGDVSIGDAFLNRSNNDNGGHSCFNTDASSRITVHGRFLRGFGAFPMQIHNGTGTFVQTSVTSTGTGDFELLLKNTENLTANRTLTVTLNNASRTLNMGGNVTFGGGFEMVGSGPLNITVSGTTNLTFPTALTLPSVVQGDLWYGSAAGTISALAKDAGASRFLKNSGTSNNPAWAQPAASDLSNGVTGSGAVALATSPTLVTPTLGVAAATSINFGGSALSVYATGSWTPIDASGAALTFSSVSANYTRIGNMIFAYATLTYPATADASAAVIGGLPFTTANAGYARQCSLTTTSEATLAHMIAAQNGTTITLQTSAAALITNATMSTDTIYFICIYPAS